MIYRSALYQSSGLAQSTSISLELYSRFAPQCLQETLPDNTFIVQSSLFFVIILFAVELAKEPLHGFADATFNHVAQVVKVEESLVLEMESFVITLIDLEREEDWIKTTDRPYLTIEAAIQDIEARKSAVLDGAMDLIVL